MFLFSDHLLQIFAHPHYAFWESFWIHTKSVTFLLALKAVTWLKKTFQKPHTKMAAYVGKYDRISAENYDEFLSELSVNFLLRKAATASTPVFEVCTSGNK